MGEDELDLDSLVDQFKSNIENLAAHEKKIDDLANSTDGDDGSKMWEDVQGMLTKSEKEKERAKQELVKALSEIESLKAEARTLRKDHDAMRQALESSKDNSSQQASRLGEYVQKVEDLQNENTSLKQENDELESASERQKAQIRMLAGQVEELEGHKNNLASEMENLQYTSEREKNAIRALQDKVRQKERQCMVEADKNQESETTMKKAQLYVKDLEGKLKRSAADNSVLLNKIAEMNDRLEEESVNRGIAEKKLKSVEGKLKETQKQLKESNKAFEELKERSRAAAEGMGVLSTIAKIRETKIENIDRPVGFDAVVRKIDEVTKSVHRTVSSASSKKRPSK